VGSHHLAGFVKEPDAGSFFHWGVHTSFCTYFDLAQIIDGDITIYNFPIDLNHSLTDQFFRHPP